MQSDYEMNLELLSNFFEANKERQLYHRYITNAHLLPLLETLGSHFTVESVGHSVLDEPIYAVKIGDGKKKILMWSQMHGNESTTTKALFDIFNTLLVKDQIITSIRSSCSLYIIPILNPDGAKTYTRVNANSVDLNRDAQLLSQPESIILKSVFDSFEPHFCYNLHGQRTIFSAGSSNQPATVSFLAPAQDEACTITPNRKVAMEIIGVMNALLQNEIPGQVGVYDDAFNLNCVGDSFQSKNVPTMLFEAGHYANDYGREITRKYIYMALLESLIYISKNNITGTKFKSYFNIPENKKLFLDIIIRNAKLRENDAALDIGIMYQERLIENEIQFIPVIHKFEDLSGYFAHKELDANGNMVLSENKTPLKVNDENVFVMIKNDKIALMLK